MSKPIHQAQKALERFAVMDTEDEWKTFITLLQQQARTNNAAQKLLEAALQITAVQKPTSEQTSVPLSLPPPVSEPMQPQAALTDGADLLRKSLRVALADRVITPEEAAMLDTLRSTLHISDDVARRIFQEVRSEVS